MKYKGLIWVPLLFLMFGCAPSVKIIRAKATTDNVALLYVYRPSCPPILFKPKVHINDVEVADLYNNGYIDLELRPGRYNINITWPFISGVKPQLTVIDLLARPGTVYYVRACTRMNTSLIGITPIYISENDVGLPDAGASLPLIKEYKPIEKRLGVDNMIIPK